MLKLSICDVMVSQKFQWRWKATFPWAGLYFTRSLCAKIHLMAKVLIIRLKQGHSNCCATTPLLDKLYQIYNLMAAQDKKSHLLREMCLPFTESLKL